MFEKILEKIVIRLAGNYIENFSKENMKVGIWSGNINIEKVKLNPNLLINLNLPFNIKFSLIKHLNIKIPWKSLSSNACEVDLDGIYILLEPKFLDNNKIDNFQKDLLNIFKFKNEDLINFSNVLKENIKNSLNNEKEEGFFSGMIEKIIDNIQINIVNIHIRVEVNENKINKSLGITLENLSIFTCNENWVKEFFKRENKMNEIFKKLEIKNFNLYFNSEDDLNLINVAKNNNFEILENKLKDLIQTENNCLKNKMNYIFNFSTIGKLILNPKINSTVEKNLPFYDLKIILNNNKIEITKYQLNDILNFITKYLKYIEKINKENDKYILLSKRPKKYIKDSKDDNEKKELIKNWFIYIVKLGTRVFSKNSLIKTKRIVNLKILNKKERRKIINIFKDLNESYNNNIKLFEKEKNKKFIFYRNIILSYDINYIKKIIKNYIVQEEAKEKIKNVKRKSWYQNLFQSNDNENNILNKNEILEIENSIKNNLNKTEIKTSEDYIFFKINYCQEEFEINLKNLNKEKSINIINLKITDTKGDLCFKNNGIKFNLSIKDCQLFYKLLKLNNSFYKEEENFNFFYNKEKTNDLIKIYYEDNPNWTKNEDLKIILEIKESNFIYSRKVIKTLKKLFEIPNINEDIGNIIKDKTNLNIKKFQNISENKMKEIVNIQKKINFEIIINSPNLIIPLENNENDKFLIKPGQFNIEIKTFNNDEILYNNILLNLKKINLLYISKNNEDKKILNEIDLKIEFYKLKNIFEDLKNNKYENKLNIILDNIDININHHILEKIKKLINKFYILNKAKRMINNIENEEDILNIYHKNDKYLALLENKTLFLFKSLNDETVFCEINIENINYIENKEIIEFQDYIIKFKDIKLKNKFIKKLKFQEHGLNDFINENIKNYISIFDNKNEFKNIDEKLNYIKEYLNNIKIIKELSNELQIFFNFKGFNINYIDNNSLVNNLNCDDFNIKIEILNSKSNINFTWKNFYYKIMDNDKEYYILTTNKNQSENYKLLKEKNNDKKDLKFININLILFSKFSKEFIDDKIHSKIKVEIGNIFVNINPIDINDIYFNLRNLFLEKINEIKLIKDNCKNKKINLKYNNFDQEIISNFLIDLNISSIEVIFQSIERTRLAKIKLKNLNLNYINKENSNKINVTLDKINLYDLTNYPNYKNKILLNEIIPNKLLKKKENNNEPILKLDIKLFDEKFYNLIKDKMNKYINVTLNNLNFFYKQQLILRYIDYINNQFLPILFKLIDNRENEEELFIENLINPFFNDIELICNNLTIFLMDKQKEDLYCYLDIEKIKLHTKYQLNKNILIKYEDNSNDIDLKNGVYESLYIIDIENIKLFNIYKNNKQIFINPFNINIVVSLLLFENYYFKYFKYSNIDNNKFNLVIDNSMRVKCNLTSLFANFGNFEYNSLLKYIDTFILFDDKKNNFFNELKTQKFRGKKSENSVIKIQVSIDNLGLILIKNIDNIKIEPLGKLFLNEFNLYLTLDENVQGNLGFKKFLGYYIDYDYFNKLYYEIGFIQDFRIINTYNENEISNEFFKNINYKFENNLSNDFSMDFNIKNKVKNFKININEIKILVLLNKILDLLEIFEENKYIKANKFYNFDYDNYIKDTMKIEINFNNLNSIITDSFQKNCLCINSNLIIQLDSFNSLKKEDFVDLHKKLLNNEIKNDFYVYYNLIKNLKFTVNNFEIYFCNFNDYINNNNNSKFYKRNLILPTNYDLRLNIFMPFNFIEDRFYYHNDIKIQLSKLNLNISLNDIENINEIIQYNLYLLKEDNFKKEMKSKIKKTNVISLDKDNIKNLNETVINFYIRNYIKITLINDIGNIYTPMINFILSDIKLIFVQNKSNTIEFEFKLESLYFNGQSNLWESFIETSFFKLINLNFSNINQFELSLDEKKYTKELKKQAILNLNISDELLIKLNIIKEIYSNLKKRYTNEFTYKSSLTKNLKWKNEKKDEFNGFSNIVLINQTGYPMYVKNKIKDYIFDLEDNKIQTKYLCEGENIFVDNNSQVVLKFDEKFIFKKNNFKVIEYKFENKYNYEIQINEDIIKKDEIIFKKKRNYIIYTIRNYEDLRKIIISSPVVFKNLTDKKIIIKIANEILTINKNEIIGIPIDLINHKFKFVNDINDKKYDFSTLIKKKIENIYFKNEDKNKKNYYILLNLIPNEFNNNLNEIFIIPPLIFKNLLPFKIVLIISDNKIKNNIILDKNEKKEFYGFNINNINLSIELDYYNNKNNSIMLIKEGSTKKLNNIFLYDNNNNKFNIKIFRSNSLNNLFYFKIFCEFFVLNSSNIPLNIYNFVNKSHNLINHYHGNFYLIGNPKSWIGINLKDNNNYPTNKFNINCEGINKTGSIVFKNKNTYLELGYKLLLTSLDDTKLLNTKILNINPKLIFINITQYDIILNINSESTMKMIKKNSKEPIFEYKDIENRYFNISLKIEEEYYIQHDYIKANQIGNFINYVFDNNRKNYKIINTDIILKDNILLAKIEELEDSLIKIKNKLNNKIIIYQKDLKKEFFQIIQPNNFINFAWVSNLKELILTFEIYDEKDSLIIKNSINFNKDYNDLIINEVFLIKTKIKNNSRVILIQNIKNKKTKFTNNLKELQFRINLKQFGISLISFREKIRIEYFYILFKNLNFLYYKNLFKTIYQLKIKFFQIDSNFSPFTRYPIFITASKLKELENDKFMYFLNLVIEKDNIQSERISIYDNIKFDLIPITITADQQLVIYSLELLKNYKKCFETKIFNRKNKFNLFDVNNKEDVFYSTNWIFIKSFFIQNIIITLTFNLNDKIKEITDKDSYFINILLDTIGFTLINIDETNLNLNGIKFINLFKTKEGLYSLLKNLITENLKGQIFKIIGSLEVIGNPAHLIGDIGNGIHEFFNEPIQGFVNGPLEGVIGIKNGTTSLLKNTISGTFNSISKITGSIGSGLSVLSFDSDFKKNRESIRQEKPEHLFDGLGKGLETIGKGVFDGITGIIMNPIKGAKNEGAKGFFKGILTGVTGVITKPISSIFDATSLTAEGIKRTFRYFDDKANEMKTRIPRVFYGLNQFFKIYNKKDSFIMKILLLKFENKFANDNYFCGIIENNKKKIGKIIIITYQNFILLDSEYNKLFSIKINEIIKIKNFDKINLRIYSKNKNIFNLKFKEDIIKNIIKEINYMRIINLNN